MSVQGQASETTATQNVEWWFQWGDHSPAEKEKKARAFFLAARSALANEFLTAGPSCVVLEYEDLAEAHYHVMVFIERYPVEGAKPTPQAFVEAVMRYGGPKADNVTPYVRPASTLEKWLPERRQGAVGGAPGTGGYRISEVYAPTMIEYSQRDPQMEIPRDGPQQFAAYFAPTRHAAEKQKPAPPAATARSGEGANQMPRHTCAARPEPANRPRKPSKTLLIVGGVILGIVLLCAVLNGIANYNAQNPSHPLFEAAPSPLPAWQATALAQANSVQVVHAASGQLQTLDCTGSAGTQVYLPNGDWVLVPCPAESVRLTSLTVDQLPAALPANMTFVSAMKVEVAPPVTKLMQIEFAHLDVKYGTRMMTLYWRGDQWINEGLIQEAPGSPAKQYAAMDGLFVLAIQQ